MKPDPRDERDHSGPNFADASSDVSESNGVASLSSEPTRTSSTSPLLAGCAGLGIFLSFFTSSSTTSIKTKNESASKRRCTHKKTKYKNLQFDEAQRWGTKLEIFDSGDPLRMAQVGGNHRCMQHAILGLNSSILGIILYVADRVAGARRGRTFNACKMMMI